jgi:CheY-like chemotaxis protein
VAEKAWGEKPVALVVEDREDLLELRMELLNRMGFHAIGATTFAQALREFRSTPAIDIVITDINLEGASPFDRSGVTLAQEIKKRRTGLPVVGYSAAFEERDLDRSDWGVFDRHLSKGKSGTEQIQEKFSEWRKIALDYRRGWLALAAAELKRLQTKYEIADRDVEFFRDLLPELERTSKGACGDQEELGPDELLEEAGYQLLEIPAGEPVTRSGDPPARTQAPVMMWLQAEDGVAVAEVRGSPELYGSGATYAAAIAAVLQLMHRYHEDFRKSPDTPLAGSLEELRNWLRKVFG